MWHPRHVLEFANLWTAVPPVPDVRSWSVSPSDPALPEDGNDGYALFYRP